MTYTFKNSVNSEPKDSRIVWEKADPGTAERLRAAIRRSSAFGHPLGRILTLPLLLFPLFFLAFYFLGLKDEAPLAFSVVFITVPLIFIGVFIYGYLEQVPSLHQRQHPEIWTFGAKCVTIRNYAPSHRDECIAEFHKGGKKIYLRLYGDEYKFEPVGKEYIFYKFNEQRGNRWRAVRAELLEQA